MTNRIFSTLLLGLALTACNSGDGGGSTAGDGNSGAPNPDDGPVAANMAGSGATETNVAPAACNSDTDCPSGIECVRSDPSFAGYCNVNDMLGGSSAGTSGDDPSTTPGISLGVPAACNTDTDCPAAVDCIKPDGAEVGYCNVNEMLLPEEGQ